jgi:hypothetical protein
MVDDSDMQALARRYLDLWERQLAASASDPSAARALSQWQALLAAAGESGAAPAPGGSGERPDD